VIRAERPRSQQHQEISGFAMAAGGCKQRVVGEQRHDTAGKGVRGGAGAEGLAETTGPAGLTTRLACSASSWE
jgi:hypothetical protein